MLNLALNSPLCYDKMKMQMINALNFYEIDYKGDALQMNF